MVVGEDVPQEMEENMVASVARGVILVHSSPRALCPHVEWAAGRALGRAVNFSWEDQPVLKGAQRTEFYWEGHQGMGAALASALHHQLAEVGGGGRLHEEADEASA